MRGSVNTSYFMAYKLVMFMRRGDIVFQKRMRKSNLRDVWRVGAVIMFANKVYHYITRKS